MNTRGVPEETKLIFPMSVAGRSRLGAEAKPEKPLPPLISVQSKCSKTVLEVH